MNDRAENNRSQVSQWLKYSVNSPWLTLITCLVLILFASIGAKNLTFRGDYNIFFDKTNPQLMVFEDIQARFAKTDSLAVVISPDDGNVFTAKTLKLIRDFTDDAWQTPYSSRVDSLANYQHTEAIEDDLLVQDLVHDEFAFSPKEINKVKHIALSEPATLSSIVSTIGDVAVINITVQLPEIDKTAEVVEVHDFVTEIIKTYQNQYPGVTFYKAGVVELNHALMAAAQQDMMTLVPLMLLVVLVFLTLMLQSFFTVLATLLVIITSVLATLGLSGWFGMYMNIATVNIPTLVLTLAVADCVHIVATMRHHMLEGKEKSQAIIMSLKVNALPVIITSVTTSLGFLMMNMSDSPVLRNFGSLASLGVMIACVLALSLFPALLQLFPFTIESSKNDKGKPLLMDRLADFVITKRVVLLPVFIIIVLSSIALIPQNKISDDSVKYFHKSSEFRQAADFMKEHISGMGTISIAIDTGEEQGIVANEFLAVNEAFTGWLRLQPEVHHVASMTDTFKRLNKNMHGDDNAYYRLPENRELAAQYLLMYEMSLPYGLDLNNQINIDKSALKLQVTIDNLGSDELVNLENRIYQWFTKYTPSDSSYKVSASSPFVMFAHIGEANMRSMLLSLPISLLLISGLLVVALRSLKLGLLSMIPNMVPALIGFGFWALISGEINLGLSVVASLTLGIVVDDAVHFLTKYQSVRKKGRSAEESVRYAFHTVGKALMITTVVLVSGFLVLAMSSFRINSDMGQLCSIVIFLALLVDLFFLPCLLMLFDNKRITV
ncbi:efflux RND transporter permease subunit [Vibrio algarum]|uniref:MMPL family transporter n=1 Tax=Vibrio algarum TaxID=3020714 RepID=A0ABT4YRJ2_9VIBR|nr:MMPL family transporter [Vibrio sp. KJ40-1]MDB1123688.1 MMPL family transporter [Vibrio sp. KJ40-1]